MLVAAAPAAGGQSTPRPAAAPAPALPYAQLTSLILRSPIIVDSVVRSAVKLTGPQAAGVAPGKMRLYVEADVLALVRGEAGLPARIGWVLDVTPDAAGRLPRLKKQRMLVFARAIPGFAAQLQLTGDDAQQPWTPALDTRTRAIIRETINPDAPPRITGVGNAFHVPGALPGEGETQVFLQTENGRPVSLSVLRRPGEAPRWAVALSEIVDEAAAPPPRDTLLWYRLACGLPPKLPDSAVAAMATDDADSARADYAFVITSLGPCTRR